MLNSILLLIFVICYLIFYKNDIFLEKRSASSLFS